MAYLITKAGSGEVQSGFITRGHRDYPPDKGGKSFHYANCVIAQEGSGSYGTRWRCDRLQPSEIWIPIGQHSPYPIGDDPSKNCKQSATTTYKQWGGRRKGGHKSTCAYGMVYADIKTEEMAGARSACMALAEGQQLRDQPYGMRWKHKDVRKAASGSPTDRYMAYPARPTRGNLRLHCYFKDPLPSKERPFQERQHARLLASGHRFITEAEREEYASLCPPKTSVTGMEVPCKPVWKKKTDYFPANPLISRTRISEGEHELRCYPDLSGMEITVDPTLSRIRQEEAHAISAQLTVEEEAEREEQRQELQEHLERGEEPEHAWHVRYRIPLMLLGGMVVLGGGAAIIQRMTAGGGAAPAPKKNPTFLFTVGINGTGRTLKIKAPTIAAAKKKYDRKYRHMYGPAYVRPAAGAERA